MISIAQDMRIARIESICESVKSTMPSTIKAAYNKAVEQEDVDSAAMLARQYRNMLLNDSDKQMTLDRISIDCSSAAKFIASLEQIRNNEWATYRQHLRDIPAQRGFPLNIDWGTTPDSEGGEE